MFLMIWTSFIPLQWLIYENMYLDFVIEVAFDYVQVECGGKQMLSTTLQPSSHITDGSTTNISVNNY